MFKQLVVAASVAISAPALAEACPEPAGWAVPERHAAARVPSFRFALKPETAHQLQLLPSGQVKLATGNARKPAVGGYAGLAAIDVAQAGTLDVLLSGKAYVDLVRDGKTVVASAHRHLGCGGIFKRVSFEVVPGRYIVQLTNSAARSVRLATIAHPTGTKRK
ncbi:hypothetical protein HJG53_05225 [Sphingomonas sp. ID1715]|uniref:hypothetical protein n=1 Tax=Sphingomonas sp. ID1715 TaxID=1656898 RepID=UPI0014897C33|nr:hypothetical protein [Sphingomonas sp. ID1715]NNM76303.1 hypothetical protein [Sphingomonas sp. ID1715]